MPLISKRNSRLSIVSILLVVAASMGLVSAAITTFNVGQHSISPTITYSGYLNTSYYGIYHYVLAEPLCSKAFPPCFQQGEVVFYLDTSHESIRLIFYCGVVYYYCSSAADVPLQEGSCINVKGTLLIPSKWPTNQFDPPLQFSGDLYVFHYSTVSESACS